MKKRISENGSKFQDLFLSLRTREELWYVLALVARNPPSVFGQVEFARVSDSRWPSCVLAARVQYESLVYTVVIEHGGRLRVWERDDHTGQDHYTDSCREMERWIVAVAETCDFGEVNPVFG